MRSWTLPAAAWWLVATPAAGQAPARPPVIDVHVHSTTTSPRMLARLDSLNVRYLVVGALAPDLAAWAGVDSSRFLPSLILPCDQDRAPVTGRTCFGNGADLPDTTWLRGELRAGRIRALGEMLPQFLGLSPADPRFDPYWRLALEFDVPVGVHMGSGPPGAAYDASPAPFKSPAFRMAVGDPILLEEVLLRHRGLRLYVMHAGWPRLDAMLALMYAHPQVYVDLAALTSERFLPRSGFHDYLRGLVNAGFGRRIMFGSDFPDQVVSGVEAILAADFLSPAQQADILCGNAARFFRLPDSTCAP